jgi:hypothetical protein
VVDLAVRRNVVGYLALLVVLAATSHRAANLEPGSMRTAALVSATGHADKPGPPSDGTGEPAPPAGNDEPGNGNISTRARSTSPVRAKHGGWTDLKLTDNTWTQSADELELLAGTMVIKTPASCTGSLGNALVLSVDGIANTFAAAPPQPASATLTVPFVVGTLSEPGRDTEHKLAAKFGVSCTKDGEDYSVEDVKVDVLKFH